MRVVANRLDRVVGFVTLKQCGAGVEIERPTFWASRRVRSNRFKSGAVLEQNAEACGPRHAGPERRRFREWAVCDGADRMALGAVDPRRGAAIPKLRFSLGYLSTRHRTLALAAQ